MKIKQTLTKSLNYLIIAGINWFLLLVLAVLSTDELDEKFSDDSIANNAFLITLLTLFALAITRIYIYIVRKKAVAKQTKSRVAIVITFVVSSFLYLYYAKKCIEDGIINAELRKDMVTKISKSDWFYGTKGKNLSYEQYQIVLENERLIKIPKEATNIEYYYEYEGFLPDYYLSIDYDLPLSSKVKTIDYNDGEFTKSQDFVIKGTKKRVTYSEGLR